MRRKKHKQTRRATNYYRINYGFHEPYKVLLDGNFIHAMRAINMGDLATHLPKLLGGTCKLYTTKCVSRELRSMGREFGASAAAARAFALHKCEHGHSGGGGKGGEEEEEGGHPGSEGDDGEGEAAAEDGEDEGAGQKAKAKAKKAKARGSDGCVAAADCIRAAIGSRNEGHWFVATQDSALRQALGQIPGCPLVFATVNGVHLETPSEVTRQKAKEAEAASRALGRHERAAEPLLREDQLAELRKQQRRGAEGAGGGGMPPPTSARFRRNKAKGPNPLAVKKKIKKTTTGNAAAAAAKAAGGPAKGRQGQEQSAKRKAGAAEAAQQQQQGQGQGQGQANKRRRTKRPGQPGGPAGGGAEEA